MKLASVVLDIPTQALDTTYTYIYLEDEADRERFDALKARAREAADQANAVVAGTASAEASGRAAPASKRSAKRKVQQTSLDALFAETAVGDDVALAGEPSQAFGASGESSEPFRESSNEFPLQVGCAVLVAFGHRQAVGFVVHLDALGADDALPESVDPLKLKEIERVISKPYFTEVGARCASFLAERYIAPFASSIRLFMPPGGVPRMERIDGAWQLTRPLIHEADERWAIRLPLADSFKPRKGAVKQQQVLSALEQGNLRVSELKAEYGNVSQTLASLEKKGVIRIETRRRMRTPDSSDRLANASHPRPVLTQDQQRAVDTIRQAACAAQAEHAGHVVLIDGVTGSGKTEVYLRAIEDVLAQGKGAMVLVPEISLTPQTVARFRGRFGDSVAVLHSRMSQGERYDQWDEVRSGVARVVVGARSALFAPMDNVGIIIIDEEHESSYKQDQAPRYVTRDVAEWLANVQDAVLVLGSATPSLEALGKCASNARWHKVDMPHRANGKPLPEIQVVDMAREFGGGNRSMFSRALTQALFETMDKGEKAVLMLNQRGFAQFLLCRDCGYVPSCKDCSTSLTYHERAGKLICHHCGYETQVPAKCPKCGSPYLKRFGAGTQRVESELVALLAGRKCQVIRMDADTTTHKGDHQRLLDAFASADAAVLLGTQMIAKGLDFDEVTLVGVINADTMLKLPDFRASERTFDLIEQVAGRAGRAEKPGRVIVQTYSAQDPAIRAAARYDRELFLHEELKLRRGLGYPPFVRLANILVWGKSEERVQQVAHEVYAHITRLIPQQGGMACPPGSVQDGLVRPADSSQGAQGGWVVLPPTACVLERLKGSWRYHITVKAPVHASIAQHLGRYFRERKPEPDVRVSIDIDPVNLL